MQMYYDHPLFDYNSFRIDAKAAYFMEINEISDLRDAYGLPLAPKYILGGGSNILLTKNLTGLVLKNNLGGIRFSGTAGGSVLVTAAGGESWHGFVQWCIQNQLGGVENLSLIPGTVGAAPIQNIGAYGVELKDVFHSLEAFHLRTGMVHSFGVEHCAFGYRDSIFKKDLRDQYFILSVTFRLVRNPVNFKLSYGTLKETLERMGHTSPTLEAVSAAVIKIRESKLPDPLKIGNAGSFFKNPEVKQEVFEAIRVRFPEIPKYPTAKLNSVKVPAAWLIEKTGWKGKSLGNAACHSLQPLVLMNQNNANGTEILALANQIVADVEAMFGIRLIPEVNIW